MHPKNSEYTSYSSYRNSEVAWIGKIPDRWEVARIQFVARLETGHTPSRDKPEYWDDCTIPWFTLGDVWQIRDGRREYVTQTKEQISELGLANSAARLLPKETVILSRTASVGYSAILGKEMATTQDFVNWICGPQILPAYLLYVFRAMKPEFRRLTMGSTHQTIYMPDVHSLVTPLPPTHEQRGILSFIRQRVRKVDALFGALGRLLEVRPGQSNGLLHEYKSTLIYTAVTGKIDVRDGTEAL